MKKKTVSLDLEVHRYLVGIKMQLMSQLRRGVSLNEVLRRELGLEIDSKDVEPVLVAEPDPAPRV